MKKTPLSLALPLGLLVAFAAPAEAAPSTASTAAPDEPREEAVRAPATRFVYRSTNLIRGNPVGLISDNFIGVRHRMFEHENDILNDNFVGVALTPQLSPAFLRVGALLEWQPLTAVRAWMNYEVVGYLGTFNFLQSFDSPRAEFSDSQLSKLGSLEPGDPERNYATFGTQLTVGLDLQAKVGPVAARNFFRAVRGDYDLRPGDRVYFDIFYDVLAPNRGVLVSNDTDVLWVTDFGLVAGVRASVTHPFYTEQHYSPADKQLGAQGENPNGPNLRVGPLVAYTFFDETGTWFSRPTLIAGAQWHVLHRWRAGADSPLWVPLALVALQVNGDLMPWR